MALTAGVPWQRRAEQLKAYQRAQELKKEREARGPATQALPTLPKLARTPHVDRCLTEASRRGRLRTGKERAADPGFHGEARRLAEG